MNKQLVLVTGGFDPLHSGHIEYFKAAKELGDELVVGVNSDTWLTRKKGRPFMPFEERAEIIRNLSMVDRVIHVMNDDKYDDASGALHYLFCTNAEIDIVFANGGDRSKGNVPEEKVYGDNPHVKFVYGVGGNDKKNSSSWILEEWSQPTTEREWGRYTVLDKGPGWQVKQLAFDAGKSLSDQRHFKRSEHWHVVDGEIEMKLEEYHDWVTMTKRLKSGDSIDIPKRSWHKATNVGTKTAVVVEVWLGQELSEDDIERRD